MLKSPLFWKPLTSRHLFILWHRCGTMLQGIPSLTCILLPIYLAVCTPFLRPFPGCASLPPATLRLPEAESLHAL